MENQPEKECFADTVEPSTSPIHSAQVLVVSGEASESDDEFVDISLPTPLKTGNLDRQQTNPGSSIPKLKTNRTSLKSKNSKYNSLLHQKLREKNEELCHCLRDFLSNIYMSSARKLFTVCNNLSKSKLALQDASNNMRLQTNDLFHLEDKLDIITTCRLLPDINI